MSDGFPGWAKPEVIIPGVITGLIAMLVWKLSSIAFVRGRKSLRNHTNALKKSKDESVELYSGMEPKHRSSMERYFHMKMGILFSLMVVSLIFSMLLYMNLMGSTNLNIGARIDIALITFLMIHAGLNFRDALRHHDVALALHQYSVDEHQREQEVKT